MFENIVPFQWSRSASLRSFDGIITSNEEKRKDFILMFEDILPFQWNRSASLRSSYGIITSNEEKRKDLF